MIYGLTYLGVFHTIVSLIALAAGAIALVRDKTITWNNTIGKIYVITTLIVCLTGFGIYQHGGFGKPHVLGIITIIVLLVIIAASKNAFGKASPYIALVSYSMTFFFHLIPTINESATRLPYGSPFAASQEDPRIKAAVGVCFVLFVIGAFLQVRSLRKTLPRE